MTLQICEYRATIVVLILKKGGVEDLVDFRPISLVGRLYKWLPRVLSNREARNNPLFAWNTVHDFRTFFHENGIARLDTTITIKLSFILPEILFSWRSRTHWSRFSLCLLGGGAKGNCYSICFTKEPTC